MSDSIYAFQAPAVAANSNRVNTSGVAPAGLKYRTSLRIANIVGANQGLTLSCDGTQFYFVTLTAPLEARPSGGVFSLYAEGEGMQLTEENAFTQISLRNANAFPVVFELFVGFQGFIDNKLILASNTRPQVAYPTYSIPGSAAVVDITDRSGSKIQDINGNSFYALNRVATFISNTDTGVTLLLQKANAAVSNGPALAAIQPTFTLRFEGSGNYRLHLGGGSINALVCELYQSIPA